MKSSAKNISLNSYDDIFSTEETREDAKREKVTDMPLSQLHPFPDHPFQVRDDDAMKETVESIKEYGVLVPAIARPARAAAMSLFPATGANTPASWRGFGYHAGYYPQSGR